MDPKESDFGYSPLEDDDELMSLLNKTDREGESSKRVSSCSLSLCV
jgi:hypothetical protein